MIKYFKSLDTYIIGLFISYIIYYAQNHAKAVLSSFELTDAGETLIGKLLTICLFILMAYRINNNKIALPLNIKSPLIAWMIITTISNFLFLNSYGQAINTSFQQILWPTVFFYFYHCGEFLSKNSNLYNVVVLVLFIFLSVIIYSETIFLRTFGQYAQQIQINEIYFILLMLPWILGICGNRLWLIVKVVLLLITVWFVFFSLKRTAMLGLVFAVLFYLAAIYYQKKIRFKTLVFIIIIAIIGNFIFDSVNEEFGGRIVERVESIKTDKGTGRLEIYDNVFNAIGQWGIPEYLFGEGRGNIGFYTGGLSAHNEFLEVFFSWGICGFFAYLIFLCRTFKIFYRNKYYVDLPMVYSSIGIYLAMCITSHLVIYPYLFNLVVGFWGYHLFRVKNL